MTNPNIIEAELNEFMATIITADTIHRWPFAYKQLAKSFKEISDLSAEVDPAEDHCWYSITLGWALANGLNPEQANEFATLIRYYTNLG